MIFEHYTAQNQVSDFNAYFASRDEAPKAKPEKAEKPEKTSPAAKAKAVVAGAAKLVSEKVKGKSDAQPAAEAPAAPAEEKPAEAARPAPAPAEKPAEAIPPGLPGTRPRTEGGTPPPAGSGNKA